MRAIGLILAGGSTYRMKDLSQKRAIAAMPVAGNYRAIDFALSNMTNSRITKVGVVTQFNAGSLHEHLSSSKWWDFGRKQGGLHIFTPTVTSDNSFWYRGTADSIYQNLSFLKESHEPYVVIASGDGIYKMDYNELLEFHMEKGADISLVCSEIHDPKDCERYGMVKLNDEMQVVDFEEKPISAKSTLVSCGIYVIRRRLLIELIEKCAEEERFDLVRDILIRYMSIKKICGYKIKTYWSNIASVEDYYRTNMDFLKKDVRDFFFRQYPDIYTKVDDLPPAKYNVGSDVRNSLVASGAIINGSVEGSLLFKKVFVGSNCTIKNSIILNDVYIGDNTYIENCIVESGGTILANSYYKGEDGPKIVIEKSDRYVF